MPDQNAHKILWVDDDADIIASAKRLARTEPWLIVAAQDAEIARMLIAAQTFAVVVADQGLQGASGTDLLEFAKEKSPATSRILLTGAIGTEVIEEAVNRAHVFRFIAKPWDNDQIVLDINKAIEHHQLKITESSLLREVSLQNRKLEKFTMGLEQLVTERTLNAESSKVQAERQLAHVRELVRFIKDLSMLTSVDELLGLIRKELKSFHELRAPLLGYLVADRRPMILFFQGKQVIEREVRTLWSPRSRMRINAIEDRVYLANEFGRPFVKTLAIPLNRRAVARDFDQESPATLFFEHTLPDDKIDGFLSFISERLQPIAIALDRILLEYHLKYTSFQWESTFDGLKDPIAIVDIDFQVLRANRYFKEAGTHELVHSSCHLLFAASDHVCRGCPVSKALQTGLPQKGQIKRGPLVYDVLSYPIRPQADSVSTNVINHYVDVTAARELHSRMVQSEKMAAIGLLAGNIAHELNNPLTGIRSMAQVLRAEIQATPATATLLDDMSEVEKAAERSQKIIENLLDFSKGETDKNEQEISLNEIVRRTLPMLKTAMREHRSEITLCEEGPTGAFVRVEPHLMQQVVFNLVNNGCQSMHDPGTITIETALVDEESPALSAPRRWFELRIRDTGSGIPPEIIESIFEPFFTTKEEGQGTGLGLSMSQSVIQKFGGEIRVESQIGLGSEFTVRLPRLERPVHLEA
jgi:two-component system NtrC family sensor kinase